MKFPKVPGDTPREQFVNLVRQVMSVPKAEVDNGATKRRRAKRRKAKTLVILIVALLLFPLNALAGNSQKLAACNIWANLVRTIAEKRDEGVTSDEIRATMAGTKFAPGQKDLVEGFITTIYGDDSITPDKAAAVALQGCMGEDE